ncbi:Nucleolar complex protein 2 [Thelohanellus kitauei]|uniref:Nucleolar complex protein 2 n=1 Tax=Thelohanellus kitauei TaxID=669202 RepID=A0A0C2JHC1_THEKT|nr:Nucleolar complex protein 2 [Thelohanellus kitauei]
MSDYTMALVSQNGSAPCHQSHIEQLKTCDPSFYEFLRTQNPDLLKFDEGEDAGVSEDDGLEPESDSTSNKSESWKKVAKKSKKVEEDTKTTPVVSIDLTTEMLKKWVAQCKKNKMDGFKNLVYSLHDIVCEHFGGNEFYQEHHISKNMTMTRKGFMPKKTIIDKKVTLKRRNNKYVTLDQNIVKKCVKKALKYIPIFLNKTFSDEHKKHPHLSSKWRSFQPLVQLYVFSIQQLLSQKISLINPLVILKFSESSFPYFHTFCDLSKKLVNNLIDLSNSDKFKVKIKALEIVEHFITIHSRYFMHVFKKLHSLWVHSYKPNVHEDPAYMETLFAIIYRLSSLDSKQVHLFIFDEFRSICRDLRDYMSNKTKKNNQDFFNWSTIAKIDVWTRLLASNPPIPQFEDLKYPVIEITFAIMRLNNSPKYFPAHAHYLRFLLRLASKDHYVPLIPSILKILLSTEFQKLGSKTNEKLPLISFMNHVPPSIRQTQPMKEAIFDQILDVLLQYICKMSESIAFPELGLFTVRWIKTTLRSIKVVSFSKTLKSVIENIEKTCEKIIQIRNQVTFGPNDQDKISNWESKHLVATEKDEK